MSCKIWITPEIEEIELLAVPRLIKVLLYDKRGNKKCWSLRVTKNNKIVLN